MTTVLTLSGNLWQFHSLSTQLKDQTKTILLPILKCLPP